MFTTSLIKASFQKKILIEYSAIKMSSTSNQMNTYDPQAQNWLRASWLHLSTLLIRIDLFGFII